MLPLVAAACASLASILLFESAALASPCEPAVRVEGDEELAREVILDLVIRGIQREAAPECPLVRVHVQAQSDSIRVVITDPYGTTERSVGAPATASALAASWAENVVARGAPTLPAPSSPPQLEDVASERDPRTPTAGISILYEMALDANDMRWSGAALAGCADLGRVCLGGIARIGQGTFIGDVPPVLVPLLSSATGVDVLASVAVPLRVGTIVVAPTLDAGIGFLALEWEYDPKYPPERSRVTSLRIGARVSVLRWIGNGFAIDAALGLNALPADYVRYDVSMPPIRQFELNPEVRLAVGIRH